MKKDLRMRHLMTDLKVRYSGYLVKKNSGMRKTEDENREWKIVYFYLRSFYAEPSLSYFQSHTVTHM